MQDSIEDDLEVFVNTVKLYVTHRQNLTVVKKTYFLHDIGLATAILFSLYCQLPLAST